ncbi:dTDP-4-dehydrorhamnose reductase [Phenylobacterium sp. J367]|uniref:dTDP-4-dehydrorhamnose reductase n=1 Tax=Phenylobacterium sp. J367 TaxID=2898435 RepID=UPI002150E7A9|nr:dTDP-4-dehydrorhamnose reductase [Phenylobacterium sp. J367]MCR5877991.1 dTDP-4-dehydrorhamnose reductase [Phenylobacterium sp. J367]
MTVRILQFGTTGQVGIELLRQAPCHDVALTALSRAQADLADPAACAAAVRAAAPDLVVIAAAYTAVDQAESDTAAADVVNGEAPGAIARAARDAGAAVVHISTDYVFAGDKGQPYREDDPIAPAGAYGRSKALGEQAVLESGARALVLRTSWVVSAHGKNFVKTMLRLAGGDRPLRVVDDQLGRPTAAADIAGLILAQAPRLAAAPVGAPEWGVFHFANAGEVTWRRFAEAIFAEAGVAKAVEPIATAEFPTPARRPAYSVLDTGRLEQVFGVTPRPWPAALAEIVAELKTEGAVA